MAYLVISQLSNEFIDVEVPPLKALALRHSLWQRPNAPDVSSSKSFPVVIRPLSSRFMKVIICLNPLCGSRYMLQHILVLNWSRWKFRDSFFQNGGVEGQSPRHYTSRCWCFVDHLWHIWRCDIHTGRWFHVLESFRVVWDFDRYRGKCSLSNSTFTRYKLKYFSPSQPFCFLAFVAVKAEVKTSPNHSNRSHLPRLKAFGRVCAGWNAMNAFVVQSNAFAFI